MRTIEELSLEISCTSYKGSTFIKDILRAYALEIVERCEMIGTAAVREEIER